MLPSARVSMQIHVENGGVEINMEKKSTSVQSVQVMMITLTDLTVVEKVFPRNFCHLP